jgi:predicted DNA-binding protein with PD1-like motif
MRLGKTRALDVEGMMRELPVRLEPGVDLRGAMEDLVRTQLPNGAFVLCGIGSLQSPRLRFAGREASETLAGPYEVLTMSGTVTKDGAHLHVSIASEAGEVRGGHIAYGSVVRTTVEALLVELSAWSLTRERDPRTGFTELITARIDRALKDR